VLAGNQKEFGAGVIQLINDLSIEARGAFAVGLQTSEVRYNATVIRHADEDSVLRAALPETPTLDATLPVLSGLRTRLAGASPGDWTSIASISNQIIQHIVDGK
jgi:hypothetical protein